MSGVPRENRPADGQDHDPAAQAPPPLPDAANSPGLKDARRWLAPRARQSWLNFQVWLPPVMNPPTKAREVIYWARQHRDRGVWQIALPAQCWHCAATKGLHAEDFDFTVRSFDNALAILIGFGSLLSFMLLLSVWLGSSFLLLLTLALSMAAAGALWMKSWPESIHVVVQACGAHADQAPAPEAVVDQEELHLFLADETLAGATRLALQEERRGNKPPHSSDGVASPRPASRGAAPPPVAEPPTYARPVVPELPPIKLDGDE